MVCIRFIHLTHLRAHLTRHLVPGARKHRVRAQLLVRKANYALRVVGHRWHRSRACRSRAASTVEPGAVATNCEVSSCGAAMTSTRPLSDGSSCKLPASRCSCTSVTWPPTGSQVAVTCRVLGIGCEPYPLWLANPVADAERTERGKGRRQHCSPARNRTLAIRWVAQAFSQHRALCRVTEPQSRGAMQLSSAALGP
jgi:hypothetical protein